MSLNLKLPIVCLITPGEATPDNYSFKKNEILETIRIAVANRINMVQVREKQLPARLLFDLVSEAVSITIDSATLLLVNDRVDVALAAQADGVHLPSNSIAALVIRNYVPAGFIVGVSTHSEMDVEKAKSDGADFVLWGPVYETPGKGAPKGIATYRYIVNKLSPFPVIGLGGIDVTNYEAVLSTGHGVAAIRFLNDHHNLQLFSDSAG